MHVFTLRTRTEHNLSSRHYLSGTPRLAKVAAPITGARMGSHCCQIASAYVLSWSLAAPLSPLQPPTLATMIPLSLPWQSMSWALVIDHQRFVVLFPILTKSIHQLRWVPCHRLPTGASDSSFDHVISQRASNVCMRQQESTKPALVFLRAIYEQYLPRISGAREPQSDRPPKLGRRS